MIVMIVFLVCYKIEIRLSKLILLLLGDVRG